MPRSDVACRGPFPPNLKQARFPESGRIWQKNADRHIFMHTLHDYTQHLSIYCSNSMPARCPAQVPACSKSQPQGLFSTHYAPMCHRPLATRAHMRARVLFARCQSPDHSPVALIAIASQAHSTHSTRHLPCRAAPLLPPSLTQSSTSSLSLSGVHAAGGLSGVLDES